MEWVRVGIVGLGNMGSAHAETIAHGKVNGMKLAAVCDIAEARQKWAKESLPSDLPVFADYNEMLHSGLIDAVIIATPHYLHPVIAIASFQAGLHVLTEKPAGVSVSAVRKMNEAAERSGRIFGIMWNQRTTPIFQRAREIVQSGALGQPKRLVWTITNWYRSQAYYESGGWRATWAGEGGGVLLNQAPHNLDLWQWIFGMPDRIRAFCTNGKYHPIEVEDDATIYAEYQNGASAVFITSTGEYPGTNRLEISGDRGKMVLENGTLRFWKLAVPEREACFTEKAGFPHWDTAEEIYTPEDNGPAHRGILQNFTDAILHGTPLLAPGKEGIRELSISNAAYLSAWTDSWVTLPVDEAAFDAQLKARIASSKGERLAPPDGESPTGTYNERWSVRW